MGELIKKVSEALFGVDNQTTNTVPGTLSWGTTNSWSPAQFCRVSSNAQIASQLGRNVGSCRGAATCNANINVELVAPNTRFEDRLQQVDLRFIKRFQVERFTLRGDFDIYNVLNGSAILSENTGYGVQWLTPYETMGGRLFKFSTQFEF